MNNKRFFAAWRFFGGVVLTGVSLACAVAWVIEKNGWYFVGGMIASVTAALLVLSSRERERDSEC